MQTAYTLAKTLSGLDPNSIVFAFLHGGKEAGILIQDPHNGHETFVALPFEAQGVLFVDQQTKAKRQFKVPIAISKKGGSRFHMDWLIQKARLGHGAEGWAEHYGSAASVSTNPPHDVTLYYRRGSYMGYAQLIPPPYMRPGYPQRVTIYEQETYFIIDEAELPYLEIPDTLKYTTIPIQPKQK